MPDASGSITARPISPNGQQGAALQRNGDDVPAGISLGNSVLVTPKEQHKLYTEVLSRLTTRAQQNRQSAMVVAALIPIMVATALLLIVFSGRLLESDLKNARSSTVVLQDIGKQEEQIAKDLKAQDTAAKDIKDNFVKQFPSDYYWEQAEVPTKSRLSWIDMRGMKGFAVGQNEFTYTEDGGKTWKLPHLVDNQQFEASGTGFSLDGFGWVGGGHGKIARSVEMGFEKWDVTTITDSVGNPATDDILNLFFRDAQTGWAVGTNGLLAKTSDGGKTWTAIQHSSKANLYQIAFFKDSIGVTIGTGLTLLTSQDDGKSWVDRSEEIAKLVPNDLRGNTADFAKTLDFQTMKIDTTRNYSQTKQIVAAGNKGIIVVGDLQSWKLGNSTQNDNRATIRWLDRIGSTTRLVAVGDNGTILVSEDNAATWRRIKALDGQDEQPNLMYVQQITPDAVMIAGSRGYIAQLELGDGSYKLVTERTPTSENIFLQLSPRDQQGQIAVGDNVLRRTQTESFDWLRKKEPDNFLYTIVSARDKVLSAFPENSPRGTQLMTAVSKAEGVKKELEDLKQKKSQLVERKMSALQTNPIDTKDYMLWLTGARALIAIIGFFALRFLVSLYQYYRNEASLYEARGDALRAMRVLPASLAEVGAWFAPKGLEDAGSASMIGEVVSSLKAMVGGQKL